MIHLLIRFGTTLLLVAGSAQAAKSVECEGVPQDIPTVLYLTVDDGSLRQDTAIVIHDRVVLTTGHLLRTEAPQKGHLRYRDRRYDFMAYRHPLHRDTSYAHDIAVAVLEEPLPRVEHWKRTLQPLEGRTFGGHIGGCAFGKWRGDSARASLNKEVIYAQPSSLLLGGGDGGGPLYTLSDTGEINLVGLLVASNLKDSLYFVSFSKAVVAHIVQIAETYGIQLDF